MGSLVAVASRIRNKEGVVYMNLVGKIFTVLIFIMSVVFASLTVTVYATHKNWRHVLLNEDINDGVLGVQLQLADETKEREQLQDRLAELKTSIETELKAKTQALELLEGTYAELRTEKNTLETALATNQSKASEAVRAMDVAHKAMNGLRAVNNTLRDNIIAVEKEKDARQLKIVKLTDGLHQRVLQLDALGKQNHKVLEDLIKAKKLLALKNISLTTPIEDVVPVVEGIVTATTSRHMIEISIGSDDALRPGHQLDVRRGVGGGASYIGRIEVVRADATKAACKVDPKWLQGKPIRKGDRVSTVQP
jgi:hypothetical protein